MPDPQAVQVVGDVLVADSSQVHATPGTPILQEVRCPHCHALLCKGELKGEIKCRSCGRYLIFGI